MATCKKCGCDFDVNAEEARLIMTRKMEELCMDCAMANFHTKEGDAKALQPLVPRPQSIPEGPKRVDWIRENGEAISFIAIPPPQLYPAQMLHRLKKPWLLRSLVITASYSKRSTEPTVSIVTNLSHFQRTREAFYAKKIPDFYDPMTGVGKIEIPFAKVAAIEDDEVGKIVKVKDGSFVKIRFVW